MATNCVTRNVIRPKKEKLERHQSFLKTSSKLIIKCATKRKMIVFILK